MYSVTEWKRTKILGLILKKIENGEALYSCKNSTLEFTSLNYILQEHNQREFRFHIRCANDKFIDIIYQHKNLRIETEGTINLNDSIIQKFRPYLDHTIKTKKTILIKGSIYFEDDKIKNMKEILLNMAFLDLIDNNDIFTLLMGIRSYDFIDYPQYLNLNEFGKLKRFYDVFDSLLTRACNDTKETLITSLQLYKSLVTSDRVKSIGVSIVNETFAHLNGNAFNYIKISYFGLDLIKINTLNRLKWIFHPGFELLCLLLEYSNNIDTISYATEKSMFKRM